MVTKGPRWLFYPILSILPFYPGTRVWELFFLPIDPPRFFSHVRRGGTGSHVTDLGPPGTPPAPGQEARALRAPF